MTLHRLAPVLLVLAACGDDGGGGTADAAPPDPCMPNATFTGELVDWDSGTSGFMGVPGVTLILRSDPNNEVAMTAPNGRFDLQCIPLADDLVDVGPMSSSTYIGGVIVVDADVLRTQAMHSYRAITTTRAADFGYDASLAHVFVHIAGDARTVTTAAAPAVTQHFDGTAWSAGNTGNDIYLGNIPVSAATTNLEVTGGAATGPTSVPLSAGSFTFVTLVAR